MGSLFRGRSRFPVPASNNDKGKYKLQRLDSPLYSTSLLPSSSNLNSQLLSSKEFLIKDPNLEIHIFREEKEIKGILVIDILIDTKM
uniref:Ovule protein n=1 Tax=Meloidogyne hapla TaxID=6305 RepID=A0A1I8B6M5_MELHA